MTKGRLHYWFRQVMLAWFVQRAKPFILGAAFAWRRLQFRTTVILVMGSLGKTTTKECLAAILATQGSTFRTYRNQNGRVAAAINLLRIRPWHRYAVIELSAGQAGDTRHSARMVRPDIVIFLNVLPTHTTKFRDQEERRAEKSLMLEALAPSGLALLNGDDPLVRNSAGQAGCRILYCGTTPDCDYRAEEVASRWPARLTFTVRCETGSQVVSTQLVGEHWVACALAAVAAARELGVSLSSAASALENVEPFPGRLQPVRVPSGAVVLRDDYNASLTGTDVSLKVLRDATATRRLLVVTDISDFGQHRKHRLRYLTSVAPDLSDVLVLVGEMAAYGKRRAIEAGFSAQQVHAFSAIRDAARFLRRELGSGDLMLLKGRTTDHAARIYFAQLGPVGCWKEYCPKRMLCDICWELDITPGQMRRAAVVPPPAKGSIPPAGAVTIE